MRNVGRNRRAAVGPLGLGALCLFLLAGCFRLVDYDGPDGDTQPDFMPISSLEFVEGTYRNAGDPDGYFSAVLWGDYANEDDWGFEAPLDFFTVESRRVHHRDVETMEVRLLGDGHLKVIARDGSGKELHHQEYVLGSDLKILDGKSVPVRKQVKWMLAPDDPVLGPKGLNIELGLNAQGDIVCRTLSWGYGLVYSLVPIGADETVDRVFRRTGEAENTH